MKDLPRITIFYDVRAWAFHNVALNIAKAGAAECSFRILGRDDWFGKPRVAARAVAQSDVVVFLWRFDLLAFLDTLDVETRAGITARGGPAFVTVVYDHLYQSAEDMVQLGNPFALSHAVAACSDRLRDAYARQPHLTAIRHVLPDGVDLARFSPSGQTPAADRPLRIGWVGNSAWGSTVDTDLKGKLTVFQPALDRLRATGLAFETRIADRAVERVAWERMPGFYHNIDVLVCTSAIEGTPNPVLEAMASGVAVVSTDVGIVSQVLGPRQSEFILAQRCPAAVADALARLIRNRPLVTRLQAENIARRETLSWETRWPRWRALFDEARETAAARPEAWAESLQRFRSRRRSRLEQARRVVAGSQLTYRTYEAVREHCPGAIRLAKRILNRTAP